MRRALLIFATASFVGYFVFLNSTFYYGRGQMGFSWITRPSGVYATSVEAGFPAARAGIIDGDRLVSGHGLAIADANDMNVANANLPVGVPTVWQVERAGMPVTVTVEAIGRDWLEPRPTWVVLLITGTVSLALALLVAWRGPQDASTHLGAWMLAALGCIYLPLFSRSMMALWRELPVPVQVLLWPAAISSMAIHVLLFAVCSRVPRPLLSTRQLALAMVPGLGITAYLTVFVALAAYAPARALNVPTPEWLLFAGPLLFPAYFFAAALVLAKGVRSATDLTDRRRAQTLLAGVATGGVAMLVFALMLGLQQSGRRTVRATVLFAIAPLFLMLPLSFAYAMLRHRLFDLRVIIRLGLQYALARGMILALVPLAVAALVADVLLRGDQPLRAVLLERGWTYATVAALTLFAYSQRAQWMAALDRRFFRERYAAQQILREVVEDVGRAPDLDSAGRNVVARIDAALHPTIVAVMRKPKTAGAFVAAAAAPASSAVPALDAGSPIATIVRALARPLVIGTELRRDLPDQDREWLQKADVEMIVPIVTDSALDQVVLLLGPRRSEEPYSREDLDLIGAIAASLALLVRRPADAHPTTATMSPRKVVNRYRLEALIGEGGMGVVYAAIDETLGRPVAVKLVREETLRGGDGLERFQREARLAASLSHPHIVTVHDFGVDESGAPYLVMERLLGRSLRTALRVEKRIPAERAVTIVQDVASAIEAAHERGMVHRDLKPENIFLTRMLQMSQPADTRASNSNFASANIESAKVLDFGIAKTTAGPGNETGFATASGVLVGTIAYMAPEQLAGGAPSPAWDVWALAVIAYEMLSGAHPFGTAVGGGGMPIARAAAIRSVAPDLPADVGAFFDRALALDAGRRPASPGALAAELRTALSTGHR